MRKTILSHSNLPTADLKGEVNTKPSMTIPNMTLSMRELLDRYTRGQDVTTFTPVYNGDDDLPAIEKMDFAERLEYAEHLKDEMETITQKIRAKQVKPVDQPISDEPKTEQP